MPRTYRGAMASRARGRRWLPAISGLPLHRYGEPEGIAGSRLCLCGPATLTSRTVLGCSVPAALFRTPLYAATWGSARELKVGATRAVGMLFVVVWNPH